MILVLSDLHFEEEARDRIDGVGSHPPVEFKRNISSEAFSKLKKHLATIRTPDKPVHVVLAGDIFDLHRTSMWFDDNIRPYHDTATFGPGTPGEAKVIGILQQIAKEPEVAASLKVIRSMAGDPLDATIHYLPGNHDRLANATPAIRNEVRKLLGLGTSPDPFPHCFTPDGGDPPILVRHGHEYDPYNFSVDHTKGGIPLNLPDQEYDAPTFGDFITVEVASGLPHLFRAEYDDKKIVKDPKLRGIYLRMLEFDDVRPQSAVVDFLLRTPGTSLSEKEVWSLVKPVVHKLLDNIADHRFLKRWLKKLEKRYQLDPIDYVQAALAGRVWHFGLPISLVRKLASGSREAGSSVSEALISAVSKEDALTSPGVRAVVAGHTHDPQVALLDRTGDVEQYYIDTGTWRNRVPATVDEKEFGRLKAVTYLIAYGKDEDLGREPAPTSKTWSFDYWSGFTQRW